MRILGPDHHDTLVSHSAMALILANLGQYAQAQKEYEAVLAIQERILGADNHDTLSTRENLADTLSNLHQYAQAQKEYQAVLDIRQRLLGPENPDTLYTRQSLCGVLFFQEKYPEAEQELRRMLGAQEHLHGSDAIETLSWRQRLGYALFCQQKYADAVTQQDQALSILQKRSDDGARIQIVYACRALARYKLCARDFPGALAAAETGLTLAPDDLPLLAKKGAAWLLLGNVPEAQGLYTAHAGQVVDEPEKRTWEQVVSTDFDILEKAGVTHSEFAHIREMLKAK